MGLLQAAAPLQLCNPWFGLNIYAVMHVTLQKKGRAGMHEAPGSVPQHEQKHWRPWGLSSRMLMTPSSSSVYKGVINILDDNPKGLQCFCSCCGTEPGALFTSAQPFVCSVTCKVISAFC